MTSITNEHPAQRRDLGAAPPSPDGATGGPAARTPSRDPDRWAAPVGADWKHRAFLVLIRVAGRRAAYAVARVVAFWYVALPSIRRRCAPYLHRRFPHRTGAWATFWGAYRLATTFAETLIDQACRGLLGPDELRAECSDAQGLCDLIAEGRGLVVVNAHIGSWQVAMPVLELLETPVSVVMIPAPSSDPRTLGKDLPFAVIDPRRGLPAVVEMVQALDRREIVGLMGDRTFGDDVNAVRTTFLGGPVLFPFAAFRLASATGAPVAVIECAKTEPSAYEIRLARVIRPPRGLGREAAAYEPWVREFAECLEDFVNRHPYQFFNFFDLWAVEPEGRAGSGGPAST